MAGALGFVAIVLALPRWQPEYDARHQLISELALGPHGWAMLPAFGCFALSLLGVQHGLRALGTPAVPRALLVAAAAGMVASGLFPLGGTTELHVAVVTLSFALIVVAMYLFPARAGCLRSRAVQAESWLLGVGAVVSVASANYAVPIGIAQRLAAACVLGWLCLVSWRLLQRNQCLNRPPTRQARAAPK
jgi:hypothetical protein